MHLVCENGSDLGVRAFCTPGPQTQTEAQDTPFQEHLFIFNRDFGGGCYPVGSVCDGLTYVTRY